MNKADTEKAVEVMKAWLDGKTVQWKEAGLEVAWSEGNSFPNELAWDWSEKEYRIKPEPMEIEVWVDEISGLRSLLPKDDLPKLTQWTKKKFREIQ